MRQASRGYIHCDDIGASVADYCRFDSYRDAAMALRWTATGFLEAEKSFRKIQGHRELWVLATALKRSPENVDAKASAA